MKLLLIKEFLALSKGNIKLFPFCFQSDYLKANPDIEILQYDNMFAPIKNYKTKFLKIIQFQFPPIDVNGERLKNVEEKFFCEAAIKFITENKLAHRIAQPKNYALFNVLPAKAVSAPFGTYIIKLQNKTGEQILESMQARYRSAIRQTEKLNVEIKYGAPELKTFQKLHAKTMERTGAYVEEYESLKDELLALPNNALLATIYIDGKIQGGVYLTYSAFSAYYFHGASADTTEASGAIKYLHYKLMCLMQDKGVKQYDFVGARLSDIAGTKLEGIQNFKKRFGSELVKGYLWKIDLDRTKCKTYDNLLKIKCKLKGTKFPVDIIDQEKNKKIVL